MTTGTTTPGAAPAAPATGGTMSASRATFLGVGAMVGAGIFALLGEAGAVAGSAVWLSFLLGGLICLLQGYSFAKLGTRFPSRGGTLEYIMRGFGPGHLTGTTTWLLLLSVIVVAAMVAVSFGGYAAALIGGDDASPLLAKVLSVVIVVAITFVNLSGASAAAKLSSLVVVTLTVLLVFSVAGLTQADPALLAPETYPEFRKILGSIALTFFAFLGFGVIAFSAQDIREPAKNLPKAMYAAIVIATVTYVAVALSVFGTLTLAEVIEAGDNALAVAAEPIFGQIGFLGVSLVALLATASALNSNLYAATGATRQLGSQSLIPPVLGRRAGKDGSVGLLVGGLTAAVMAIALDLSAIAALGSAVSLLVFIIAGLAHLRVLDQTGANRWIVWASILSAGLVFVMFVVSTFIDAPSQIVLIGVIVVLAIVLELAWSRVRDRGRPVVTPA
ncbi:MAG TPA: APC family permease [Candidatus Limnocylindrales bacterium]|nr:APC family permease [Candidatus Limnocylindrales bacterium]